MLRGEVNARALRVLVGSRVGGLGKRGKCNALGCWRNKSLLPLMAGSGWSVFFLCPPLTGGLCIELANQEPTLALAGAVVAAPAAGLVETEVLMCFGVVLI